MNSTDIEWPHPDLCPSSDCRGQFLWLRHYGMICTVRLLQLTDGQLTNLFKLSRDAQIERSEGLGLA